MTRVLDPITSQLPTEQAHPADTVTPGTARPLVMRLATEPAEVAAVDMSAMVYDEDAQVMMMRDGGLMDPAWKHTSTQTSTSTADRDKNGPDSDTDATGT